MKPLEFVVILLCVLLGLGRGADLAFATDAATGLCTAGAVWWQCWLAAAARCPRSRCAVAARRQACWPLPGQCVCWLPARRSSCSLPVR